MTNDKKPQTCDDRIRDFTKKLTGTQKPSAKDDTTHPQRATDKKKRSKAQKDRRTKRSAKTFVDLMGPPPLLADEDPAQYFALYEMLRLKFEPRDIIEEIYVRQVMDDAWLVTRYRRMNAHILNLAQPTFGDEMRLNIERYRNTFMGSEDLLDQRTENLLLHQFSQYSYAMRPNDMIAKQFEKRIVEINLIESIISRCLERMRRSHLTLEDLREFMNKALDVGQDSSLSQSHTAYADCQGENHDG